MSLEEAVLVSLLPVFGMIISVLIVWACPGAVVFVIGARAIAVVRGVVILLEGRGGSMPLRS